MTIVNELESVERFVKTQFPAASTVLQTPLKGPAADEFLIRFLNETRQSETRYHTRADREYQIVYYGASAPDVLDRMDALSDALYRYQLIPINGSLRYIRVGSFSISQPFETEGKQLFACIGVLQTEIREARTQEQYEKIMHIYTRYI